MRIIKNISEMREWRKDKKTVGFVPTMGFLHKGHRSLIEKALKDNEKVVVSIFVNPMQFSPTEDLEDYPRDLSMDIKLCEDLGVDIIFYPDVKEMYPENFSTFVDMNKVTKELCGKSRQIHFRGVCTIVSKLFNIILPTNAYFGEKDAQQLSVIKRMVKDLNIDIKIVGCPIIREKNGLAVSSRNSYLTLEEGIAALVINRALKYGRELIVEGERDADKLISEIKKVIQNEALAKIDYVEVVESESIEKLDTLQGTVLVAAAVFIGKTRLIDNFMYQI